MDFDKIKAQLRKIDRTVDMIEADGQITRLEVDLLKDYIKKLYELTLTDGVVTSSSISEHSEKAAEVATSNGVSNEVQEAKSSPVAKSSKKDVAKPENPAPEPEEVAIEEDISEDILALFEEQEATQLSEKLSKMAISDIEKSMSINEKIFTINELFNGNSQEFRSCLEKLNGMSSYNEAVEYLSKDVAGTYEWTDKAKRKKALNFIQLVNRKFQ